MIFVKKNSFLDLIAIFTILLTPYIQLNLLPIHYATQPVAAIFILIIFFLFLGCHLSCKTNLNFSSYYFNKDIFLKWFPISIVVIIFSIYSSMNGYQLDAIKFCVNILVAILFYWFGYTRLGLNNKFFYIYIILSSIPLFIIGYMEIIGLKIDHDFYQAIIYLREHIVTINFDKIRLHLLFSEPSFIATYALMMFFIIQKSNLHIFLKTVFFASLTAFMIIGGSLNNMIVISIFTIASLFLSKLNMYKKTIIAIIGIVSIFIVIKIYYIHRIINIENDISGIIRFTHIIVLWKMFISTNGIGSGFGLFSDNFINYISTNMVSLIEKSKEMQSILSGNAKVVPYSMLFSILGQMGLAGILSFLYLFKNLFIKRNKYKPYYLALLASTITALPWGLPFIWILLGLLDYENNNIFHGRRKK